MAELFKLIVLPDDGDPYVVSVDMRTLLKWETKFPGRSFSDVVDRKTLDVRYCYELAYLGAQRAGLPVPKEFVTFKENNEVISVDVFQKLLEQQKAKEEQKAPSVDDLDPEPVEDKQESEKDAWPSEEEVSTGQDPTRLALSTTP